MAVFKGGLEKLSPTELPNISAAIRAHEYLLAPSNETHGDQFVLAWVTAALSLFEFGMPLDAMQKAYRVDAWCDEAGKYPAWALERVTTYLRARTKLPSLGEVVSDLNLAKNATERRLEALKRIANDVSRPLNSRNDENNKNE